MSDDLKGLVGAIFIGATLGALICLPEILLLFGVIDPSEPAKQKYQECVQELQDKQWCWDKYR